MKNLYERINGSVHREDAADIGALLAGVGLRSLNEEIMVGRLPGSGWVYQSKKEREPVVTASADYGTITLVNGGRGAEQTERFLLRTAFECRFCHEGIVSLHAACVEKDGWAVAFTGQSGRGKSTRALAWVEGLDARWISGDRPAIRLEKEGATACGVPWDGKEQILRDVERPLLCIMEVRRSPANCIRRISAEKARDMLMRQCFVPMWDVEAAAAAMANVRRLAQQVPVYRVFCGPEREDAAAIHDILFNHPEKIREDAEDMRIKEGFVLRNVVDEYIVMPTGDNIAVFEGAVVLNEVSAFIYRQLENPVSREDVLSAVLAEYDVDQATAERDLDRLLADLERMGVLER